MAEKDKVEAWNKFARIMNDVDSFQNCTDVNGANIKKQITQLARNALALILCKVT